MALQSSGLITLAQIQAEFGGSNPISLSEYYRNGAYVTSNNTSVPTSGAISVSNFYGAVKAITVTYQLIGAGGAGGHGNWNSYATTRAPSGGSSSVTSAAITNITAAGGLGGLDRRPGQGPRHQGQEGPVSLDGLRPRHCQRPRRRRDQTAV